MLQVDDAFKIGRELVMVVAVGVSVSITEFLVQGLLRRGVILHSTPLHAMEEILVLSKVVNSFVWSMLIPMSQFDGWPWCAPVDSVQLGTEGSFQPVEDIWETQLTGVNGVLTLARRYSNGEIGQIFENYCQKHLCMESWEFILETVRYQVCATVHFFAVQRDFATSSSCLHVVGRYPGKYEAEDSRAVFFSLLDSANVLRVPPLDIGIVSLTMRPA